MQQKSSREEMDLAEKRDKTHQQRHCCLQFPSLDDGEKVGEELQC